MVQFQNALLTKLVFSSCKQGLRRFLMEFGKALDYTSQPGGARIVYREPRSVSSLLTQSLSSSNATGLEEALAKFSCCTSDATILSWTIHLQTSEETPGQLWSVMASDTMLPHIEAWFGVDRLADQPRRTAQEVTVAARALDLGIADFADLSTYSTKSGRLGVVRGRVATIYVLKKIWANPKLARLYSLTKSSGEGSLLETFYNVADSVLASNGGSPLVADVEADRSSVERFLTNCDERLLAEWGRAKFQTYLTDLSVSLDDWLSRNNRKVK
jgi:hypothetical protein